ncbi:low affinity immunoglobulin epsilon Fc receptor-like [Sebastes umbrosus]|uniref:low affinity immunoglobulin epsilon Fc receptor-like n=1 Tax=Sebastes umbrosus TaxID=72105 RepID=UPI00189F559B|nr:low affinity immunoglobulin epsilon Fc receptor-like [Sebastes umbrosus]
MSEEEVNYASVVFQNKKHPPPEAIKEEEIVYDEVKVRDETPEQTPDTKAGFLPDKKANKRRRHYQQLACCLGILCVILLLGIIALCVLHFPPLSHESDVRELNQLKENQTALLEANRNLTNNNNKLSSDNENLRRDHNNLTVQFDNLTKGYTVLESKTTSLTAENQKLNTSNQELETRNGELETQKNNLAEQIRDMETNRNELNVSRAQWSIDAYCTIANGRKCQVCQDGWKYNDTTKPSCYAINDAELADRRTWEEAREDCRGKNSNFAVIHDQKEKKVINAYSWGSKGTAGYWIGLRVEDGKWKWIDGSYLTESNWAQPPPPTPPSVGHCAISVQGVGWISRTCDDKQQWICKKNALSL